MLPSVGQAFDNFGEVLVVTDVDRKRNRATLTSVLRDPFGNFTVLDRSREYSPYDLRVLRRMPSRDMPIKATRARHSR